MLLGAVIEARCHSLHTFSHLALTGAAIVWFCLRRRKRQQFEGAAAPVKTKKSARDKKSAKGKGAADANESPPSSPSVETPHTNDSPNEPLKTDVVPYAQYRKSRLDNIRSSLGLSGDLLASATATVLDSACRTDASCTVWTSGVQEHPGCRLWGSKTGLGSRQHWRYLTCICNGAGRTADGDLTPRTRAMLEDGAFAESAPEASPRSSPRGRPILDETSPRGSGNSAGAVPMATTFDRSPQASQELPTAPVEREPANIVPVSICHWHDLALSKHLSSDHPLL